MESSLEATGASNHATARRHDDHYDHPVASGTLKSPPSVPQIVRTPPPPLGGGLLTFLRFAREHNMLRLGYVPLIARWGWLKLRWRGRLKTDGLCFVCPGLELQIAPRGRVEFGRFVWVGHGTKIRCHEGVVEIGAKTVIGQECTISAYRRVRIGEQCVIADRAMFIDFDHGVVEVERPIRVQGIYKRDVEVGSNVWIGYGACVLRGVTVGDNSVIGTSSVVTADVPSNAVVGGIPAKLIRMRDAPKTFRWAD
jgi:acetyltransferase-like isoleucine patch superfamily enzyme